MASTCPAGGRRTAGSCGSIGGPEITADHSRQARPAPGQPATGKSCRTRPGWGRSFRAGRKGNGGTTRGEDLPPFLADLDCAVRGSGPFLCVCLGSSVGVSPSSRGSDAPRTKVVCAWDFRPGGAGNPAQLGPRLVEGPTVSGPSDLHCPTVRGVS